MNIVSVCAKIKEDPREVYVSSDSTALRCLIQLPPVGNKAPTVIEMNLYGKTADRFTAKKDSLIFLSKSKLRFDLESRSFSLHGGVIANITDEFPIFNSVILCGRCVKDIDPNDPKQFKTTDSGLIICNQTLAVVTGKNQSDLFNFYAINNVDDKIKYAELMCNYTRKGTGATIEGKLVTDVWKDKNSNEQKSQSKIQLVQMTLAPRLDSYQKSGNNYQAPAKKEINDAKPDPYGDSLPTLSDKYSSQPELEEAPF
jgi:single-stranded DNA-binding protein